MTQRCHWCWRPLRAAWYEYAGYQFCDQRCQRSWAATPAPITAPELDLEQPAGQLELEEGSDQ